MAFVRRTPRTPQSSAQSSTFDSKSLLKSSSSVDKNNTHLGFDVFDVSASASTSKWSVMSSKNRKYQSDNTSCQIMTTDDKKTDAIAYSGKKRKRVIRAVQPTMNGPVFGADEDKKETLEQLENHTHLEGDRDVICIDNKGQRCNNFDKEFITSSDGGHMAIAQTRVSRKLQSNRWSTCGDRSLSSISLFDCSSSNENEISLNTKQMISNIITSMDNSNINLASHASHCSISGSVNGNKCADDVNVQRNVENNQDLVVPEPTYIPTRAGRKTWTVAPIHEATEKIDECSYLHRTTSFGCDIESSKSINKRRSRKTWNLPTLYSDAHHHNEKENETPTSPTVKRDTPKNLKKNLSQSISCDTSSKRHRSTAMGTSFPLLQKTSQDALSAVSSEPFSTPALQKNDRTTSNEMLQSITKNVRFTYIEDQKTNLYNSNEELNQDLPLNRKRNLEDADTNAVNKSVNCNATKTFQNVSQEIPGKRRTRTSEKSLKKTSTLDTDSKANFHSSNTSSRSSRFTKQMSISVSDSALELPAKEVVEKLANNNTNENLQNDSLKANNLKERNVTNETADNECDTTYTINEMAQTDLLESRDSDVMLVDEPLDANVSYKLRLNGNLVTVSPLPNSTRPSVCGNTSVIVISDDSCSSNSSNPKSTLNDKSSFSGSWLSKQRRSPCGLSSVHTRSTPYTKNKISSGAQKPIPYRLPSTMKRPVLRVPNFARIHQLAFNKMEDIQTYAERKVARAAQLLRIERKQLRFAADVSSPQSTLFIPYPTTPIPKQQAKKITSSKQQNKDHSSVKMSSMCSEAGKSCSTLSSKSTSKAVVPLKPVLNEGVNRFGFRFAPNKKPDSTKATLKNCKQVVANKINFIAQTDKRDERRNQIKGVRSNRRFDLLMKMRGAQK